MNKPQKSWGEIQLAIAAVAITATLGFWNMFSAGQKQEVAVVSEPDVEVPPTEAVTQMPAPTPTQGFLPVKIIFGGTAPQQQTVVQTNNSQPQAQPPRKHKPPARTGSSKP